MLQIDQALLAALTKIAILLRQFSQNTQKPSQHTNCFNKKNLMSKKYSTGPQQWISILSILNEMDKI